MDSKKKKKPVFMLASKSDVTSNEPKIERKRQVKLSNIYDFHN